MIFKDKKGMLDDFFDVLFLVTTAFFLLIFMYIFLVGGVDNSEKATAARISLFNLQEQLFHYLNYPVYAEGKQMKMQEVILNSVNSNNSELFEQETAWFLEHNNLVADVSVYNAVELKNLGKSSSLINYGNVLVWSGASQVSAEIPNLGHAENPSLLIIMVAG